jgi:hypothetical protein
MVNTGNTYRERRKQVRYGHPGHAHLHDRHMTEPLRGNVEEAMIGFLKNFFAGKGYF